MKEMYMNCQLESPELDRKVAELEGITEAVVPAYTRDWNAAGEIIERDHIYLSPPHDLHVNAGKNSGWHRSELWTATVSAATRQKANPHSDRFPGFIGRGAGPTPLIAAMRAYVDSKCNSDGTLAEAKSS